MLKSVLLMYGMGIAALACENDDKCIDKDKINPEVYCAQEYDPVCGCDDMTYGNDCMAEKSGVTTWTEGECKQD